MSDKKWYESEVVLFACQKCNRCCKKAGMVHFTQEDIRNAAQFLEMTEDDFTGKYLFDHNGIKFIRVSSKKWCPFLTDNGCRIHEAKPSQCSMYPFWPHTIETKSKWRIEGLSCRGINKGREVRIADIVGNVDLEKVDKEMQNQLFCLVSCSNNYRVGKDGTCRATTCIFYAARKDQIIKDGCRIFTLVQKLEDNQ